jgi:hypothetical protein
LGIEDVIRQLSKLKQMEEKENHDSREEKIRAKEHLKVPTGFECLVCGTKFVTYEERKHHLEEGTNTLTNY